MKTVHCFGAGLVGSYVARKLAEEGHNVQVYDLDSNISFDHPNITVKHVNAMDVELSIESAVIAGAKPMVAMPKIAIATVAESR